MFYAHISLRGERRISIRLSDVEDRISRGRSQDVLARQPVVRKTRFLLRFFSFSWWAYASSTISLQTRLPHFLVFTSLKACSNIIHPSFGLPFDLPSNELEDKFGNSQTFSPLFFFTDLHI